MIKAPPAKFSSVVAELSLEASGRWKKGFERAELRSEQRFSKIQNVKNNCENQTSDKLGFEYRIIWRFWMSFKDNFFFPVFKNYLTEITIMCCAIILK